MDRFDLIIEVPEISAGVLLDQGKGEPSQIVAARVAAARQFESARRKNKMANAMISIDQLDKQIIMENRQRNYYVRRWIRGIYQPAPIIR